MIWGPPGLAFHKAGGPGNTLSRASERFPSIWEPPPGGLGLSLRVAHLFEVQFSAQSRPRKVSAQLLPVLLGRSGQPGPRLSGHHAKAPGHPLPLVVPAAAEVHLSHFLENGVNVFTEWGRALAVAAAPVAFAMFLAPRIGRRL